MPVALPELGGQASGEEMPAGTWFCALTDFGNFSAVRVDAVNIAVGRPLTLTFTTYSPP